MRPTFASTPGPYTGPVPIVTHLHGSSGVGDESDGYAEAWFLPDADDIPEGFADRGHLVRVLRRQGRVEVRRELGTRVRDVPVPERPAGVHALVPRPHARDDEVERLRGTGRLLHHPGRPPRGTRPSSTSRTGTTRGPAGAGAERGRPVPSEQALPGDPDRDPGSLVRLERLALLPGHAGVLRRDRGPVHPVHGRLADLEPGVLREHDHGERPDVAVPHGRAATVPLPVPQRMPVTLPDPRLHRHPRGRGLADRERGRVPRGPREPDRRPREPPPDGPRGARGRDRRLHERASRTARVEERRSRRAVRRRRSRRRLRAVRSRDDRAGDAVRRGAGDDDRRNHASEGSSSSPRSRP